MMATRRDLFEIEAQVPRGTLVYLSPDRIEPNPRQPRQQVSRAGLEELKASIASRGILQALLGVRGENGRVTLIAGHRRWQAARELGLARVPLILVDHRPGGADPLLDAIIENVQRENLAPWEEGESYRQLAAEFGWDHRRIASTIGKSRPYVTQRIRAAENLAPAVKEFFLTNDLRVLFPDQADVTDVTPSDKNHNQVEDKSGNQASPLAGLLSNVELVRRLTALPAQEQVAALRRGVEEARQQQRQLQANDLALILKNFRDRRPSPKARLKNRGGRDEASQLRIDFDWDELEVVRWSAGAAEEGEEGDDRGQAVDRLIEKYEKDLARLRSWKERRNGF